MPRRIVLTEIFARFYCNITPFFNACGLFGFYGLTAGFLFDFQSASPTVSIQDYCLQFCGDHFVDACIFVNFIVKRNDGFIDLQQSAAGIAVIHISHLFFGYAQQIRKDFLIIRRLRKHNNQF